MLVDRKKLELAMARACMNSADLPPAAGLPRPTVQNAIVGKSVRPGTLGRIGEVLVYISALIFSDFNIRPCLKIFKTPTGERSFRHWSFRQLSNKA